MKILANLLWECSQGDCPYCWVYGRDGVGEGFVHTDKNRLSARDWIKGLNRLPPGSVDFCGGEPTLLGDDFVEIVGGIDRFWAVTTNLARQSNVDVLKEAYNRGRLIMVNCSYHGIPIEEFVDRFRQLQAYRMPLSITCVINPYRDYSEAIERFRLEGFTVSAPPYQNPKDVDVDVGMRSVCTAGLTHLVVNCDGTVYCCLSGFRSSRREEFVIGHLLDVVRIGARNRLCSLQCDPEERKCWQIRRYDVEGVDESEARPA